MKGKNLLPQANISFVEVPHQKYFDDAKCNLFKNASSLGI